MKYILTFHIITLISQSQCCLKDFGQYDNSDCAQSETTPLFSSMVNDKCIKSVDSFSNWISWRLECFDGHVKFTSTSYSHDCLNSDANRPSPGG